MVQRGFSLLHLSSRRGDSYRVRVWIEPLQNKPLSDIASVTYRLWDDFKPARVTTEHAASNFDLWLNPYGEFPVIALVKLEHGTT